jgi:glycopeptide antibiotics resistance protein
MTTSAASGPRESAPLRAVGVGGLVLAVPIVLLITLWPSHLFMEVKPQVVRGLEWMHERELLEWLYWTRLEVLANVAMLVPVALLLTFALGARRWWLAVAACVAGSAGVELVQHFMPGRVASVGDVVANGLGACIGALLAAGALAVVARHRMSVDARPPVPGRAGDTRVR